MRKSVSKISFLVLVVFSGSLQAKVTDTLSVQQRQILTQSPVVTFRQQIWQNPALHYYKQDFSHTTVSLNGLYEHRGNATLVQEGNGKKEFRFGVSSFVKLTESDRVFGSASYQNGRRENVQWNENTDFEIVYPYVTGDSIGGYMQGEEYCFTGGYARLLGKWNIGVQLAYRASVTYRDKDPRPRNVSSDLTFEMGASRTLGNHLLGASLNTRKYDQRSDVKFLSDKGATSVYQMLGLGMDYVRFAGSLTSSNYTGFGVGGSLSLAPLQKDGLSVFVSADYFHFTKELTTLNYAPVNELENTKVAVELAWMKGICRSMYYGVKLDTQMEIRKGTENVFGEPTGNVYPQISSIEQYENTTACFVLSGVWGKNVMSNQRWGWSVTPTVAYKQIKPQYKGISRFVDISSLHTGLTMQSNWRFSALLITTSLNGGYHLNLKSTYSLPGLDTMKSVGQTLLSNIRYLGDNYASTALLLRGDYAVTSRYAIFLSGHWQHQVYNVCGSTNYGELSLGFIF